MRGPFTSGGITLGVAGRLSFTALMSANFNYPNSSTAARRVAGSCYQSHFVNSVAFISDVSRGQPVDL